MKRHVRRELRATAFHEAGHAVAAVWNHVRLHSASIQADGNTLGRVHHANVLKGRDLEWDASNANEQRMRRLVMVSLAGPASERLYRLRNRLPKWSVEQSRHDYHNAINLLGYFVGSNEQLEADLQAMEAQAGVFVRDHWHEIQAVAEALLRHETSGPRAIRQIIAIAGQRKGLAILRRRGALD